MAILRIIEPLANVHIDAERYESLLPRHVTPYIGTLPVRKLQPAHIVGLYRKIRAKRYSGQTCLHVHRALHSALVYGLSTLRIMKENVMDHVAAPKIEDREMQPISEEQIRMIIEAARATKREIPVLPAALTRFRRGELLAIR